MCAAMKSTAEASSGWSIQTVQISPVVTGTGLCLFTFWMSCMSWSNVISARSDEVDGGGQLRMVDPDCPDFTSRHRDRALPLHFLDELYELVHRHLGAQRGFVADDDGVDVAVVPGKVERGPDFPLIAGLVLVDPGADRDLQAEFGRDWRNKLGAAGCGIGADGTGIGCDRLQIGANLFGGRANAGIRVLGICERRVGNAVQLTGEIRSRFSSSKECPQAGMHARYEREHGSDGAHRLSTTRGEDTLARTRPQGSTLVVRR